MSQSVSSCLSRSRSPSCTASTSSRRSRLHLRSVPFVWWAGTPPARTAFRVSSVDTSLGRTASSAGSPNTTSVPPARHLQSPKTSECCLHPLFRCRPIKRLPDWVSSCRAPNDGASSLRDAIPCCKNESKLLKTSSVCCRVPGTRNSDSRLQWLSR